jgi:hypothetical protein
MTGGAMAQGGPVTVRDWTVECNEEQLCVAEVMGYSQNGDELTFGLVRSAEENSEIFIGSAPTHPLELGMRVSIDVVGLPKPYGIYGRVENVFDENVMVFSDTARGEIIHHMREGRQGVVTIDFGGSRSRVAYRVSLSGVTTALLFMDQMQGRVGRYDAAVAWAGETTSTYIEPSGNSAPPSEATAPSRQSSSQQTEPSSGRDGLQLGLPIYAISDLPGPVMDIGLTLDECNPGTTVPEIGAKPHSLPFDYLLFLVPCTVGDVNFTFYVASFSDVDPNHAKLYEFENPPFIYTPKRKTLINPRWDAGTGRLTATQYYSPNADCGVHEVFSYFADDDVFYIEEFREKHECDGVATPPAQYPLGWNAMGKEK